MSNYSFKCSCGASELVSHIVSGCHVAFANAGVTSDGRMLMIGMVRDTDIVMTACVPLIMESERMLSQVYAIVRKRENSRYFAVECGVAEEKYYSDDDTAVHVVASTLGFDFDGAVAMYTKQYPDARRMGDDDVRISFDTVCKDFGIEHAIPTLPLDIEGVQVEELDTVNSKELVAEFVQSVMSNALRDLFIETVEAPVMAAMQMLAGEYKKENPIELVLRAMLGIYPELDLSEIQDEQGAIESGMVILSNYGVNIDFLAHPTMRGAKNSIEQLMIRAYRDMDESELFNVYACLKFSLDRARKLSELQATGEVYDGLPDDTPMFGNFSLN